MLKHEIYLHLFMHLKKFIDTLKYSLFVPLLYKEEYINN